jgi:hypothetical protein
MKINKRECKKYANPGLKFKKNDGLLIAKSIKYIVRTALKNIAGRRILILYFYKRERAADNAAPEYALFQCRDDYITLQYPENGNIKWLTASLYNLGDRYDRFIKGSAFYRQEDEQRVTKFCNDPKLKGFDALNRLQEKIMAVRLIKRIKSRERKIVERMKSVPPVPRGFKNWIHREVMPQYIFYDYKRGSKPMPGYCTACRRDVFVSGARHNGKGKCPRCRKDIIFKSSGKAKQVWNRATVQILQKAGNNELVIRIFKVYNQLHDWRNPYKIIWESARIFDRWDENNNITLDPYYYSSGLLTNWKHGYRPRFSFYQYNFECDFCGFLFCGNISEALAGTPWQYCQIERFYTLDREALEVLPYLSAYYRYPAIEYLIKLGLTHLVSDIVYRHDNTTKIINENGKNLREALGVEPKDLPVIQKINADGKQLELCRELTKQSIRTDEKLLIWYKALNIYSPENVLIPLRYSTPVKLMRYIGEQFEQLKSLKTRYGGNRYEKPGKVLSEYRDYLHMGGKLGYDFTDSFVLFPKNLPEVHDQASKLFDAKKDKIFNRQIQAAYKGLLEKYRFTKDGLTIIPPKTAKEIVQEGHTLHHCVHSYVERVAEGECVILFVRETANINAPFYTLELRNGRVIQIHGKNHSSPTPEVNAFLELWKRKKLQTSNMTEAA